MKTINSSRASASGSAIFIILIAIVLLAAVTAAVMNSTRVGEGSLAKADESKMDLKIAELTDFFASVQAHANNLMIASHIGDTTLDFRSSSYLRADNSVNCSNQNNSCTTASCRIFAPDNPAGVRPVDMTSMADKTPQSTGTKAKNGHAQITQIAVSGLGTAAPDMVLLIRGVSPSFCNYYNKKQGITTNYTNSTNLTSIGETEATSVPDALGGCGTGATFNSTKVIGDEATDFQGKSSFCAPADLATIGSRLAVFFVVKKR